MKKETIYFRKLFTGGLLKGLSVTDQISFPSSERERYSKAFRKGKKHGKGIITDSSFQKFWR